MTSPKSPFGIVGALLLGIAGACERSPELPVPSPVVAPPPVAVAVVDAGAPASADAGPEEHWPLTELPPAPPGSLAALNLPPATASGGRSGSIDPLGVEAADEEADASQESVRALAAQLRVVDSSPGSAQRARLRLPPLPEALADLPPPRFVDGTFAAGLDGVSSFNGGRVHAPFEDSGSGLGWADYDNDGDPDLYVSSFNGLRNYMDRVPNLKAGLLYRNNGDGTFTEVTNESKLVYRGQNLGVSWADYDGDGQIDLYLTVHGINRLFRNNGDKTFTDVTEEAGVGEPGFSAAAAWGDYDRDGDIDLYVGNYSDTRINNLDMKSSRRRFYTDPRGKAVSEVETNVYDQFPITDIPPITTPQTNTFYRNNGDGTFTDVTKETGTSDPQGRSLGVVMLDLDGDQWPDMYVANDVSNNTYFRNRGDGTFEDASRDAGLWDPRAGMGMAVGDPDGDGDMDFFMSYFSLETNGMYENLRIMFPGGPAGRLRFAAHEDYWGLAESAFGYVGWGTGFFDWDLDGDLDLYVGNGHVADTMSGHGGIGGQRNFLYHNLLREEGVIKFADVTDRAGPGFNTHIYCSRGGAVADFDLDGDQDILFTNMTDPIRLLRNDGDTGNNWLRVQLKGAGKNTEALGSFIHLKIGEHLQTRAVYSGAAYLSTDERTAHFGLGKATKVDELKVIWPTGKETLFPVDKVKANSLVVIQQDEG